MLKKISFYWNRYFVERTEDTFIQFIRYLFVGGAATIIDMFSFYVVLNIFNLHYLIAQTIGFILGLATNYGLSIAWIFKSAGNIQREFSLFALIGIGGLLLSYFFLWIFISVSNMHAFRDMLAKLIVVVLVLVWNFGMRKKFVF